MTITSDDSDADNVNGSSTSLRKTKRHYPAERQQTSKRPRYPQHQKTFSLKNNMEQVHHSTKRQFNARQAQDAGRSEHHLNQFSHVFYDFLKDLGDVEGAEWPVYRMYNSQYPGYPSWQDLRAWIINQHSYSYKTRMDVLDERIRRRLETMNEMSAQLRSISDIAGGIPKSERRDFNNLLAFYRSMKLFALPQDYYERHKIAMQLYKAFCVLARVWAIGLKSYLDELLRMGRKEEAIAYLNSAYHQLEAFEKAAPELQDEWNRIREGLDCYRRRLHAVGEFTWKELLPPAELPFIELTDSKSYKPPPTSVFEQHPSLKGAFDVCDVWWTSSLSSIAEVVIKGWSWIGQVFDYSTYVNVTSLLYITDAMVIFRM